MFSPGKLKSVEQKILSKEMFRSICRLYIPALHSPFKKDLCSAYVLLVKRAEGPLPKKFKLQCHYLLWGHCEFHQFEHCEQSFTRHVILYYDFDWELSWHEMMIMDTICSSYTMFIFMIPWNICHSLSSCKMVPSGAEWFFFAKNTKSIKAIKLQLTGFEGKLNWNLIVWFPLQLCPWLS